MGINKALTLYELMFGFDGRIGRFALLKHMAILLAALFVFYGLNSTLFAQAAPALHQHGLSAVSILCLIAAWPAAAIISKRLHDMDRSGLHSFWICPLVLTSLGWSPLRGMTVDNVVLVLVAVWLVSAPGTIGPNHHGLKSGMRVDRIIDPPRVRP